MPLTTLEPHAALIVVDLQRGVVSTPTVHAMDDVVAHAASLAHAFRERELPVVLVNATGRAPGRTDESRSAGTSPARAADWAELVDELDEQPSDHRITKQRWGAFTETDLDRRLRDLDVTQVFVVGVATSAGVESTARHAHELGYHVVLVTDAMTDRDRAVHDNSVERIFPRLGETTSTQDVLTALSTVSK